MQVLKQVFCRFREAVDSYISNSDSFKEAGNRYSVVAGACITLSSIIGLLIFGELLALFFYFQFCIGVMVGLKPLALNIRPDDVPLSVVSINFLLPLIFWWVVGPEANITLYIISVAGPTIAFLRKDRRLYIASVIAASACAYGVSWFWNPKPLMYISVEKQEFAYQVIEAYVIAYLLVSYSLIAIAYNSSERKLQITRQRLAIERDQAVAKAKTREKFLAMVSHEFRTPLATIISAMGVIRQRAETRRLSAELNAIESASLMLLQFFQSALDFARYRSGRFTPKKIRVDFLELIEDAAEITAPQMKEKNIRVEKQLHNSVSYGFQSDPTLLRQLLLNLIGNAIKFSNSGKIVVRAEIVSRDSEKLLHCEVSDFGKGIPSGNQESVFDFFDRGSLQSDYPVEGMGLGLAVCKEIANSLGGVIGVESEVGKGSTFWFDIPVTFVAESITKSEEKINQGLSILLVEDHPFNRRVMKEQLEQLGHHVIALGDFDCAITASRVWSFDVVVSDFYLGTQRGIELAQEVRSFNADMPVMIVTASMDNATRKLCNDVKIDDIFLKPLDINEIQTRLSRMLSGP